MTGLLLEQGDDVWFDRGFGPERGTVWAHDRGHVAVAVGRNPATGSPIERLVLSSSQVYGSEEEVPVDE